MLFWSRIYFLAVKLPIFSVVPKAGISGCGTVGLIFKHLIPNILPQCIVFI